MLIKVLEIARSDKQELIIDFLTSANMFINDFDVYISWGQFKCDAWKYDK